ncbi:MAG: glycoside hydrolase family 2 TIM barrel-domain containing protein [Eubacteriales bacterium]|nr:glycoside hydrolase family 2 TIM barrel-domain containing protein [Eubacteriales bacterium]
MEILKISGNWNYALDSEDTGILHRFFERREQTDSFHLPGTTCEHAIGQKQEWYEELNRDTVRGPREKYEYVGVLWLWREIEIPEEFKDQQVTLYLERVNMASQVWIDGEQKGRQIVSLSVPHQHVLGELTPGRHVLTLRLDNRNLLNIDGMASGYSLDTQGFWNGVVGRLELHAEAHTGIHQVQIYPNSRGIRVRVLLGSKVHSPFVHEKGMVEARVITPEGKELPARSYSADLYNSTQPFYFDYEIQEIQWWNEFHPNLYQLKLRYFYAGSENIPDRKQSDAEEWEGSFGMRIIQSKDQKFLLNVKELSLRGTTNCAIFPLTGYPDMGVDFWKNQMLLLKEFGLNHLRFHAWCPPDSAFRAADEIGIYLSVEMPLWLNHDVCALELGEDPLHRSYFLQEGNEISRVYGNHPSFLFFSNGNENMGDFSILEDTITQLKAIDPRRLYTLTTNFDHPVLPCEDYFCAYEAKGKKLRIEHLHEEVGEHTCVQYEDAVQVMPVPVMSFEVGQYCVYPDVSLIEEYKGNMMPLNLDVIEKDMKKKQVRSKLKSYIEASGNLSLKLYKEDIEALLRTRGLGGFGLLALQDYTGQCTATVGMLDIFGNNKGIVKPEEFRHFCGPAVPLFMAKRIYRNTEILSAEMRFYDFRENTKGDPTYHLRLFDGEELYKEMITKNAFAEVDFADIRKPTMLTVILEVEDYQNQWTIYVYPEDKEEEKAIPYLASKEEVQEYIENGGAGVISASLLQTPVSGSFLPAFWSPAFFRDSRSCGAMIQKEHPLFEQFPTVEYPDFQWKKLLTGCKGVDIRMLPEESNVLVEMVPNFMENIPGAPLAEIQAGKGKFLICGLNLKGSSPEVNCMKKAITTYVKSEKFVPEIRMKKEELLKLL